MLKEPPSPLLRYGVALLTVILALTLTLLLWPLFDPPVFSLFFAAVMISAWYGGLGPGLLATTLAGLCCVIQRVTNSSSMGDPRLPHAHRLGHPQLGHA